MIGLKERYAGNEIMLPGGELSEEVANRLNRELGVIEKLGFSNYFLIVWDFVRYAREIKVCRDGSRQWCWRVGLLCALSLARLPDQI